MRILADDVAELDRVFAILVVARDDDIPILIDRREQIILGPRLDGVHRLME